MMRCDREQTAHLQTALLHPAGADRDTNRSAGLHSSCGVGHDYRRVGLVEFAGCRSDNHLAREVGLRSQAYRLDCDSTDGAIQAEATRQATRGANRNFEPLWRLKARDEGRLRSERTAEKSGEGYRASR